MNKDVSESKNPESLYFDARNLRFITNETRTTGSFVFEKGNKFILKFPKPSINPINKSIDYTTDSGLKQLEYSIKRDVEPRNQLETNYFISKGVYKQSGEQKVIGYSILRDGVFFGTTDNEGFDCLWLFDDQTYDLKLIYMSDLNMKISNLLECITNFENDRIEKVYFIDKGRNQMRFINVNHSILNGDYENLIDVESSLIGVVGDFTFSQPEIISSEQGGTHTAGTIQYAYSLYKLNGASTRLSPISEMYSLGNGDQGGGKVNEVVSSYPVVKIPVIDQDYTNLKLYSIKYTSYNQTPEIRLLVDKSIQGLSDFTFYDTGDIIEVVNIEEFYFMSNAVIYIPKSINTKFNRLFSANYREKVFDINIDTRAYSFKANTASVQVFDSLTYDQGSDTIIGVNPITIDSSNISSVPIKHNVINDDFEANAYKLNSNEFGGTGRYISWNLERLSVGLAPGNISKERSKGKFLKDREIYRIGIQFYNKKGQISLPKWITDLRVNTSGTNNNLNGKLAAIKITLNAEFFVWLNNSNNFLDSEGNFDGDLKPVGFKLLRAERNLADRSIICQGPLNSSYVIRNTATDNFQNFIPESNRTEREIYNNHPKLPSVMRPYDGSVAPLRGMFNYARIDTNDYDHPSQGGGQQFLGVTFYGTYRNNGRAEIFDAAASSDKRSMVFQFNQLFQIYSPEITFNQIQKLENSNLNIIGAKVNDYNAMWAKRYDKTTREVVNEAKIYGAITPYSLGFNSVYPPDYDPANPPAPPSNEEYQAHVAELIAAHELLYGIYKDQVPLYIPTYEEYSATVTNAIIGIEGSGLNPITGNIKDINKWGLFGLDRGKHMQMYRRYTGEFKFSSKSNNVSYDIFGNPLIVETGAGRTVYSRDTDLSFYNTFSILNSDSGEESKNTPGFRMKEVNSWGARCGLIALGNSTVETIDRISLDQIFKDLSGLTFNPLTDIVPNNDANVCMIGELFLNKSSIYMGLLYGGNDYESRKRTNYIEVGSYKNLVASVLGTLEYTCINSGDIFVDDFKFTKMVKTNIETYAEEIVQSTEIVNVTVETTVDLKNRSDYSVEDWDSRFQPKYEEYQDYNQVYSQEPNFFLRRDIDYNFREISEYSNVIIPSKIKIAGEKIDSWTSYLINDAMALDGKFGAINALISNKDEIYAFQDKAIAFVSISPRVQVQGDDGVSIQLGTGQVLNDYKYLTTSSGSVNKLSILSTERGMFYFDLYNKSFCSIGNEGLKGISDMEGFHKYFVDEIDISSQKNDNPLTGGGIVAGWDKITNDVYISFFKEDYKDTLSYNLSQDGFSSFYDYNSTFYIHTKGKTFTINHSDGNSIYEMHKGKYNIFYNKNKKSSVSFIVNPEPMIECTLNNLEFKSEAMNGDQEANLYTWERIKVKNEFQDSGLRELIIRKNIRKENRKWRLTVPRDNTRVNRMRNTWNLVTLESDNYNSFDFRCHDIIAYYNPNYKVIQ